MEPAIILNSALAVVAAAREVTNTLSTLASREQMVTEARAAYDSASKAHRKAESDHQAILAEAAQTGVYSVDSGPDGEGES